MEFLITYLGDDAICVKLSLASSIGQAKNNEAVTSMRYGNAQNRVLYFDLGYVHTKPDRLENATFFSG